MTIQAPFGVDVQFTGLRQPAIGPNNVEILQQEFCHDLVTLQFWADDVDADSYFSGMPMAMVFGRPGESRTFYGYVNHAERQSTKLNPQSIVEKNSTIVYCAGPSWLMKQAGTRVWTNYTAPQIVTAIAELFGLDSQVVPHSTVWPSIPMAGQSYWQFCVMLAKRIGYTFYCNGIQLIFKPRAADPANLVGYVRAYDYRLQPSALPTFKPSIGTMNPAGGLNVNWQMSAINPRTSLPVASAVAGSPVVTSLGSFVDQPIFNKTIHLTVNSQDESDAKTQGAGQLNALYMTAEAVSVGDAHISQGSLVFIANVNGAQDGLWFVESARHCFTTQTYSLDLSLGRDSRGATSVINYPIQLTNSPQATLVGNLWQVAA